MSLRAMLELFGQSTVCDARLYILFPARVSRLTYQTVIGVRYPELVRPTPTGWQYGRYVSEALQGGFLPVFWDVPKSTMHAVSDVGALVEWLQEHIVFGQNSADNLAVLHNQNHMVHEFGLSAWVTQSGRQVISRSVTSCAGMTAYMVVVAQTKVGFLTGGRGEKFRSLPEEERRTQEEEAYARATVALTRARKICVIFCPLDMKGLIGAATVMGSLMYGAGHCWNGMVNMHLRQPSLNECLGDITNFSVSWIMMMSLLTLRRSGVTPLRPSLNVLLI